MLMKREYSKKAGRMRFFSTEHQNRSNHGKGENSFYQNGARKQDMVLICARKG